MQPINKFEKFVVIQQKTDEYNIIIFKATNWSIELFHEVFEIVELRSQNGFLHNA